jgi:hypothetical protein
MKVWIDIISGDEMVSDSYPHTPVFNNAGLEVKAKYRTKGVEQIAIASDDVIEDDGTGETVVDVVDAFKYNEIPGFQKKDFMAWVKGYLAKITEKLNSSGKEARVAEFKAGATEMVKFIISKWDEMQVFAGPKYDMDAGLVVAWTKEQTDDGPTFLYFLDGLKEEKF